MAAEIHRLNPYAQSYSRRCRPSEASHCFSAIEASPAAATAPSGFALHDYVMPSPIHPSFFPHNNFTVNVPQLPSVLLVSYGHENPASVYWGVDVSVQFPLDQPLAFIRPTAGNAAWSFQSPVAYPDVPSYAPQYPIRPSHETFRGPPFLVPPHCQANHAPPISSLPDRILSAKLLKQIEYYFSLENLHDDHYLRSQMDDQGWVPITLIAGFNRVKQLTSNIQFILDSLRSSQVAEVQGDKIRKRHNWHKWKDLPQKLL